MKRLLPILVLAACAHVTGTRMIDGPQGKLYVDDGGSGRGVPVLFVHGNGADLTQWRAQLDHLRKSRRAVALDLHGYGKSEGSPSGDFSLDSMVRDILAVADATGLRRFVIVGHSYGGTVVAAFAAKHPDRLAGVVFADAAGNVQVPPKEAADFLAALRANKDPFVRQWFAPVLVNASVEVKNAVFRSVDATSANVMAAALQSILEFDMLEAVAAYPGPKLAIAASAIEQPVSLHVQVPSVPTKKMAGTSHWLMMDKPEEFNQILDEFLASVERDSNPRRRLRQQHTQ